MKRILLFGFVAVTICLYSCNSIQNNSERKDSVQVKKDTNPGYYYSSTYQMYEKDIKRPGEGICYSGVSVDRRKNDSISVSAYINFVSSYDNQYSLSTATIDEEEINYVLDYLDACTSFKGGKRKDGFDNICYNLTSKDSGEFSYYNEELMYIDKDNNRYTWGMDVTTARNMIAGMKEKIIQIRKAETAKDTIKIKEKK